MVYQEQESWCETRNLVPYIIMTNIHYIASKLCQFDQCLELLFSPVDQSYPAPTAKTMAMSHFLCQTKLVKSKIQHQKIRVQSKYNTNKLAQTNMKTLNNNNRQKHSFYKTQCQQNNK